jgi:hypothetical protein
MTAVGDLADFAALDPFFAIMEEGVAGLYRRYGATFSLDRCYDLAIHHDQVTGVVVLEYASQGRVIATGTAYRNRYISVLSITDRKITHWRDYLDPTAVFDAIGWPASMDRRPRYRARSAPGVSPRVRRGSNARSRGRQWRS